MKRISVTGYVPVKERENVTLAYCGLVPTDIRHKMKSAISNKLDLPKNEFDQFKKVRVTAVIDVETL